MRFGILGPTDVCLDDGSPVPVGGRRLRVLLTVLLADAGRLVSTDRLLQHLYGDRPNGRSLHALRSQVSRLRHVLGQELIETHPTGYLMVVARGRLDVQRFEELADDGRQALLAGDHHTASARLREALALWRGRACADLEAVDPVVLAIAGRLDELRQGAIEDYFEAELSHGGTSDVLAEIQAAVAAAPLRERLRAQLIRALAAAGRQTEAFAAFEEARFRLADKLGVDPSDELRSAHLALLHGNTLSPSVGRRRLPAQATSFIGQEQALDRLAAALGVARLVTLTGPGGVGKTRMALEVAARLDGEVCLADLAPVPAGTDPATAVADSIGLRSSDPARPRELLLRALADRSLLVVIDNCEHLVDEVAELVGLLLARCPGVRVMATSREALRVAGETRFPVPPLTLPATGDTGEAAAVRLFADRASMVDPGFRLDADSLAVVRRICVALDGLPLAIELAAGRVGAVPLAEIATRLDDRFQLLDRGDRTAAARHKTLRAAMAWSWDLLEPAERELAARLTVFAGGATIEAVTAICGVVAGEVLRQISSLAEKSLVMISGDRYGMLETIRVYAAEQLGRSETEALHGRHAAYFLDLAAQADPRLRGPNQVTWAARLAAEHGNLRAALRWAIDTRQVATGLRLVAVLSTYWWFSGLRGEAASVARELLAVVGVEPPPGLRDEYLLCVLNAMSGGGDDLVEHRAAAAAVVAGQQRPFANPMTVLLWSLSLGRSEQPAVALKVLRRNQRSDDPWIQAAVHLCLGYPGLVGADLIESERAFTAALAGFRSIGDGWGSTLSLTALAEIADWSGDLDRSTVLTNEALALAHRLGADEEVADLLCRLGDLAIRQGDLTAARRDYESAAGLAERAGPPETSAAARHGLGRIARLTGDLATARLLAERALRDCPGGWVAADLVRASILGELAEIADAEGLAGEADDMRKQAEAATVRNRSGPALSRLGDRSVIPVIAP